MVMWTVLVKTQEGTQPVSFEADFAETSDDGKEIDFSSVESIIEALRVFEAVKPEHSDEQRIEAFRKFMHALSKLSVASFKTEAVIGYYQDTGAKVE